MSSSSAAYRNACSIPATGAVFRRNNFEQLLGENNICNHIDLALARARQLVGA